MQANSAQNNHPNFHKIVRAVDCFVEQQLRLWHFDDGCWWFNRRGWWMGGAHEEAVARGGGVYEASLTRDHVTGIRSDGSTVWHFHFLRKTGLGTDILHCRCSIPENDTFLHFFMTSPNKNKWPEVKTFLDFFDVKNVNGGTIFQKKYLSRSFFKNFFNNYFSPFVKFQNTHSIKNRNYLQGQFTWSIAKR